MSTLDCVPESRELADSEKPFNCGMKANADARFVIQPVSKNLVASLELGLSMTSKSEEFITLLLFQGGISGTTRRGLLYFW